MLTDTDWLALATLAAALIGLVAALIDARKQRKAILAQRKEISEIHSKVGNGFAEEVIEAIGKANSGIDALRIQVGIANSRIDKHVKWHAAGVTARGKPK